MTSLNAKGHKTHKLTLVAGSAVDTEAQGTHPHDFSSQYLCKSGVITQFIQSDLKHVQSLRTNNKSY